MLVTKLLMTSLYSFYVHFFSLLLSRSSLSYFFFFNDTATTEIYTLSLHDALPICSFQNSAAGLPLIFANDGNERRSSDRKSTRLNSSHTVISYAVFCLKKKKNKRTNVYTPHERTSLNFNECLTSR